MGAIRFKPLPTKERILSLLEYYPTTGKFTWKLTDRRMKLGAEAGCLKQSDGYIYLTIDRACLMAHRVAWFLSNDEWPLELIDHKNRNRSDNRISNLRIANAIESTRNQKVQSRNKSGYRGVHWNKGMKKWKAAISINKKQKCLGYFETAAAAAICYGKVAKTEYGEFYPK